MKSEQFAALDLGSNSFHLVTARVVDGHLQILSRFKQQVQLGRGLNKKHLLKQDAIERGLAALHQCAQRLEGFAPEQVYVVATHTLRQARNADVFLARAAQVFQFPINIISGHEEARLIYKGVAHTSPYAGSRLVLDIGGGSTELVAGHEFAPVLLASKSMGSVTYTARFFPGGKLSKKSFKRAVVAARSELEDIAAAVRKFGATQIVGTSGMIKAIGKWVQLRDGTAPGTLTRKQLMQCQQELLAGNELSALTVPGIEPERKSILPAGLAILQALMAELELEVLDVHDAALREGVLYELTERVLEHIDVRQRTVNAMASRYRIDEEHASLVAQTATFMLERVVDAWQLDFGRWRQRLIWAAYLHEVGLHINSRKLPQHSGYIVQYADMPGFSDEEQRALATLVRHFRKKLKVAQMPDFYLFSSFEMKRMVALMRLAVLFNTDRQPSQLLSDIRGQDDLLQVTLTEAGGENPMLVNELEKEVKQQQKLGLHLRFTSTA